MTRLETGRAQHDEGPEFDRPFASPTRHRAQRPPRSPLGRLLAPAGLLAPLPAGRRARAAAPAGNKAPAAPLRAAAKPVLRATDPITVNGARVVLRFDQSLLNVLARTSAYTVKVGGNSFTPTSTAAEDTNGIRLSVGFTIAPDETVTVQYDKPTSGNNFNQNAALEKADSIPETTATNNNTNPWSTTALSSAEATTNNADLVANTSVGDSTTEDFSADHAQLFTTGSRAIRLATVGLTVSEQAGRGEPIYEVHVHASDESGLPGDSLGELTKPTVPTQGVPDHARYTAPTAVGKEIDLAADTTCFVVLDTSGDINTGTSFFSTTDSDDQEANATTGWSIADTGLVRNKDTTTWQTGARARRIAAHGAPVAPTLAPAAVNGTALTLAFNADLAAGSVPAASAFTVRSSSGAELLAPLRSSGDPDASSSRSL